MINFQLFSFIFAKKNIPLSNQPSNAMHQAMEARNGDFQLRTLHFLIWWMDTSATSIS